MNAKSLSIIVAALVALALLLSTSGAMAQDPTPGDGFQHPEAPVANVNADDTYTYQGMLKLGGAAYDGTCDFRFNLMDTQTSGSVVHTETKPGVAVSKGLFSVPLTFGFGGLERWIEVGVSCPASGSPSYTVLAPRQKVTGAPYAISLKPGAHIQYLNSSGDKLSDAYIADSTYGGLTGAGYYTHTYGVGGINYAAHTAAGVVGESTYVGTDHQNFGVIGLASKGTSEDAQDVYTGYDAGGLFSGPDGLIAVASSETNSGFGVTGVTTGTSGVAVYGKATATTGTATGVWGVTSAANGWAGYFATSSGNGVYVTAATGKAGLNVAAGTKSAVVAGEDGARLLYTEEATEVWFADYGFGKLTGGKAIIPIDPVFAHTVDLNQPYHVFIQVYGDADVYVTGRTASQFEVRLRSGDPSVEFSYRLVATRLGYAGTRLERAPWADNDPNLYPDKAGTVTPDQRRLSPPAQP